MPHHLPPLSMLCHGNANAISTPIRPRADGICIVSAVHRHSDFWVLYYVYDFLDVVWLSNRLSRRSLLLSLSWLFFLFKCVCVFIFGFVFSAACRWRLTMSIVLTAFNWSQVESYKHAGNNGDPPHLPHHMDASYLEVEELYTTQRIKWQKKQQQGIDPFCAIEFFSPAFSPVSYSHF